jgi:hypothetical protein
VLWRIKEAAEEGRKVEIGVTAYDNSPRDRLKIPARCEYTTWKVTSASIADALME